ncbi:Zinc/iron permease [Sanghuangporus baumii]|uniref:Zinc/iron permease n=1 Tax=Sanghuangporus baumii TaxID=108892 RepID=A0A9Q5I1G2_SANBA|nr:Zinc/iron permease [Sanghuangporus baumii]
MDLRQYLGDDPLDVPMYRVRTYKDRAFALFRVSKAFYRIAFPLAFRFLAIHPPQWSFPFLKKLLEDTSISSSMDTLVISKLGERFRTPKRGIVAEEKKTTERIVLALRTVQHLVFDTEFANFSDCMAEEVKLSLQGLHLGLTGNVFRQILLTQFRNLTRLILRAEHDTDGGCPSVDTSDITGRPCFDSLVYLKIINQYTRFDVINMLQSCDFPSVTTLDFIFDFGTARSSDIPYGRLPSFPKAQVIRFTGTPRGSHLHLLHAKNSPFEKLVLKSDYRTCQNLLTGGGHITEVLNNIKFSTLTSLRELQIVSVEEWPWQNHELKNNAWQGRAQALIDTYGFKITDASVAWETESLANSQITIFNVQQCEAVRRLSTIKEDVEALESPVMRRVFAVLFPFENPGWNASGEEGSGHSHSHSHVGADSSNGVSSNVSTSDKSGLRKRSGDTKVANGDARENREDEHQGKHTTGPSKLSAYLNLFGDFVHNIMAASFYSSPLIGATTTLACFAHEIPHEIADYSILVRSGFSKRQAMQSQYITAVGAFVSTVLCCLTLMRLKGLSRMYANGSPGSGRLVPKGGWETSDGTLEAAASREALEEGLTLCFSAPGVHGTITKFVTTIHGVTATYHFYELDAVSLENDWLERRERRREWVDYAEAIRRLQWKPELAQALMLSSVAPRR